MRYSIKSTAAVQTGLSSSSYAAAGALPLHPVGIEDVRLAAILGILIIAMLLSIYMVMSRPVRPSLPETDQIGFYSSAYAWCLPEAIDEDLGVSSRGLSPTV